MVRVFLMKGRLISVICWIVGALLGITAESIAYWLAGMAGVMSVVALMAIDSYRIQIWRFRSGIAARPLGFVLLILFLGWIMIPWYAGLRLKIWTGHAELREGQFLGYKQPWRSMPLR